MNDRELPLKPVYLLAKVSDTSIKVKSFFHRIVTLPEQMKQYRWSQPASLDQLGEPTFIHGRYGCTERVDGATWYTDDRLNGDFEQPAWLAEYDLPSFESACSTILGGSDLIPPLPCSCYRFAHNTKE